MKPIPTPINWILAGLLGAAVAVTALTGLGADTAGAWRDYADGKYTKARTALVPLAEAGDAAAANALGVLYADGLAVKRDFRKAAEWYERAARQGHGEAMFNLGFLYYRGADGLPADRRKAALWLSRAADDGHAYAAALVGPLYGQGKGVDPNPSKAKAYCLQGAKAGIASAQYDMGVMLAAERSTESLIGAYTWFAIAADRGYPGAARNRAIVGESLTNEEIARAEKAAEGWAPRG